MACCFGVVIVKESTRKVVENCGKFDRVLEPGCTPCVWPCLCNFVVGTLSMRLQQMEVYCDTKTKDNVFVNIKVAVQFQIKDNEQSIQDAQYRLTNAAQQIESYVFDVVRSYVPKIELDEVFETKEEISLNIKQGLTESMSSFGYEIISSPITDIDPDHEVKRAMNEINKAKRLRVAALDAGEAIKIKAIKEAEAEAARTEIQAKADAEAKFMNGQGIARQRQAIVAGLRDSINTFKTEVKGVGAKDVMDLMVVTQYFDMMKEIGAHSKSNAVFMDHSPAALTGLTQSVQAGFLSSAPIAGDMARR